MELQFLCSPVRCHLAEQETKRSFMIYLRVCCCRVCRVGELAHLDSRGRLDGKVHVGLVRTVLHESLESPETR